MNSTSSTTSATATTDSTVSTTAGIMNEKEQEWRRTQIELKKRWEPNDRLDFTVPTPSSPSDLSTCNENEWTNLKYIGGIDVSFFEGTMDAIGCLAVLSFPDLKPVYETFKKVTLTEPYIPGYLAFREAPVILDMLETLKREKPEVYPQIVFIDGNGTLHPAAFGSACQIGLLADIPSIGIGKNFLEIKHEGLTMSGVKAEAKERLVNAKSWFPLVGTSGVVYGAAVRTNKESVNPIFVSCGHRVSLETALKLTFAVSKFRVPEPIRMADQASRRVVAAEIHASKS
ncbi:hypothetical protein HDU76_013693 [Blyttiomyces sp. JEL0837]|nr:hypothetical protein HDU76_013693 [Blyttiomyces sp. JEL0837]